VAPANPGNRTQGQDALATYSRHRGSGYSNEKEIVAPPPSFSFI
jgi:hypothetical protein